MSPAHVQVITGIQKANGNILIGQLCFPYLNLVNKHFKFPFAGLTFLYTSDSE